MVNTRRSESSSVVAPESGQRYQTRKNPSRELGSSCDSNGAFDQEEESVEDDDSWSSQEKSLGHLEKRRNASPLTRVRELRHHTRLRIRQLRDLKGRTHNLTIYSPHKMRNIMDSDIDDCYSPRRLARKNRFTKITANIERRAALSLRPIIQKSYKDCDNSAPNCNSEDSSEYINVRRSQRTRNTRYNRSWIDDDQMHKMGYPNLNRYSDEDSRDVEVRYNTRDSNRRITRHNCDDSSKKFLYKYNNSHSEEPEEEANENNRSGSHDKENKEGSANQINSRMLRSVTNQKPKEVPEEKTPPIEDVKEIAAKVEKTKSSSNVTEDEDGVADEADEEEEEDEEDEANEGNEDEEVLPKPNAKRKRQLSSSTSSEVKGYSLRHRPPKPTYNTSTQPTFILRKRTNLRSYSHFNRNRQNSSSSSDSSDSEARDHHSNAKYSKGTKSKGKGSHSKPEQLKSGANQVMPIAPEILDPKITFASVGGLSGHVQCLKEMILLPMMYPEVFQQFKIQPPKGILFYGPPGTGKTLLARALANECSFGSRKVSFFMRKGADLLSKWIGESEKMLRLLFEQAAEKKPSIIFFDELDGLAPVRSSKQDQVHASIVSTLLALMDGLDSRGDVIVIGATNRIDAIDPALRRPGRFDRELFFPLPAQKEREEILNVHVSQWKSPPNAQLISYLADGTVGYGGSDLRALCSEAVIQSFRRTYPQVYTADYKLLLNPDNVKVEKIDFLRAKSLLVPASHRVSEGVGHKLNPLVKPLLEKPFNEITDILKNSFPHGTDSNLAKVKLSANVRPAHLLLAADGADNGHGTYLAPALLHHMEHIHNYVLDLAILHREAGRSPEEACIQVFHEAKRNVPSIIYVPNIETFWKLAGETVITIFLTQIQQIAPNSPILILATSNNLYDDLPDELKTLYSTYRNEVYEMPLFDESSRYDFWRPLLWDACLKPARTDRDQNVVVDMLPRAPTPVAEPQNQDNQKVYEQEERTLRELRIFLRDMCKKLASNRLFFLFTKPVNVDEVPDYPNIIKKPMDLETMMTKVDIHRYECAKDFLADIELICKNALEYNPARTSADKQIRHRACALRDYAYALIKSEMDSDFEDKCQEISMRRRQRNATVSKFLPSYLLTANDESLLKDDNQEEKPENNGKSENGIVENGISNANSINSHSFRNSSPRKRKISSWQRGHLKKRKRTSKPAQNESLKVEKASSDDESKEKKPESETNGSIAVAEGEKSKISDEKNDNESTDSKDQSNVNNTITLNLNDLLSPSELLDDPLEMDDIDQTLNETVVEQNGSKPSISQQALKRILEAAVLITDELPLLHILDLHFQLSRIIKKYMKTLDRTALPNELAKELKRFKEVHKTESTYVDNSADDTSNQ